MKKVVFFTGLSLLFLHIAVYAQQTKIDSAQAAIKEGKKASSGAKEDILSDYLQVAADNITSTSTIVQLKLNWFALNTMDSVNKYKNKNYIASRWQRNGQFLLAGGIGSANKFNSIQAGFSYNLLNCRDTALHYYTSTYAPYYAEEGKIIQATINRYKQRIISALKEKLNKIAKACYENSSKHAEDVDSLNANIHSQIPGFPSNIVVDELIKKLQTKLNAWTHDKSPQSEVDDKLKKETDNLAENAGNILFDNAINQYVKSQGSKPLNMGTLISTALTDTITKFIDAQVVSSTVLHKLKPKGLTDLNHKILTNYEELVHYVAQAPLLTFGYNYTYGTGTVTSSHVFGFQYIQGLGALGAVKAKQLTGSLTDTIGSNDPTGKTHNFNRNIVALQGGYNQVLVMQKKVSVMEINIGAEDDQALSGYTTKTNKNTFLFDAYYRVRLPATPWIRLAIKYDPRSANVLGFLSFTYNLDTP
jgi:predicted transcriptional regulator